MTDLTTIKTPADLKELASELKTTYHEARDKTVHLLQDNPEEDDMVRVRSVFEKTEKIYKKSVNNS